MEACTIYGLNNTGQPGAKWMDGQWGTAQGGTAGSIYKIDGATGAVTLFTTIGANSMRYPSWAMRRPN